MSWFLVVLFVGLSAWLLFQVSYEKSQREWWEGDSHYWRDRALRAERKVGR